MWDRSLGTINPLFTHSEKGQGMSLIKKSFVQFQCVWEPPKDQWCVGEKKRPMTVAHAWDKAGMVSSVHHCGAGSQRCSEPDGSGFLMVGLGVSSAQSPTGVALSMPHDFPVLPFAGLQITLQHADYF